MKLRPNKGLENVFLLKHLNVQVNLVFNLISI